MIVPEPFYPSWALAELRDLIGRRSKALYLDAVDLARLLDCTEEAAEEARRWLAEDGLETRA